MHSGENEIYSLTSIKEELAIKGYSYLRDFIGQDVCVKARSEYFMSLEGTLLHAQNEPFDREQLQSQSWRKTAIGSGNGVGDKYSQVLQTTYMPFEYRNYKNLQTCFQKAIVLRNQLTDIESDFGAIDDSETSGFWNASRVHHYPCGGGHMAVHTDTHFPPILSKASLPFLQVAILLSNRNVDFRDGGGFVFDRNDNKVFLEDDRSMGAAIIFDGSLKHGVDDIDLDAVLNWSARSGRIALFSNLYVS